MSANPQLYCPVRGALGTRLNAADGLTVTEDKRRCEVMKLLLSKGYLAECITTETTVLRLGHAGRNSLRADVVVYDRAREEVERYDLERRREFIAIVAEVKRDSAAAQSAKNHQLIPALSMVPRPGVLGIYWDDVQPLLLFRPARSSVFQEASIAALPHCGSRVGATQIHFEDLQPATDLTACFARLDDILHQAGHTRDERQPILLHVLLAKLYDEESAKPQNERMAIQDFSVDAHADVGATAGSAGDVVVERIFAQALQSALQLYGDVVPEPAPTSIGCSGAILRQISRVLCLLRILDSAPQIIQDFFMYFGKARFKVDLGQYFTPPELIRLIVEIANPRLGERIIDPACGTADFLVGARHVAWERHQANIGPELHGVDVSSTAVELSTFNMLLNGGRGFGNIVVGDSLQELPQPRGRFRIAFCNPPFGARILEKRPEVLEHFELANPERDGAPVRLKSQETGLLFVEVCLRSVEPGGRVFVILPNGYLGNRSERYVGFRRWLFQQARVVAVIGFPRFTFKKSGADVSAAVVVLERRPKPLPDLARMPEHPIHFNLVEKVGWDLQSKQSGRVFKRDPRDGTEIRANGARVLDADFDRVLRELRTSSVVDMFPWLAHGIPAARSLGSWSTAASSITAREDLCLDPKRWCEKYARVARSIRAVAHLEVGRVIRPVTRTLKRKREAVYRYVEIEKIYEAFGSYIAEEYFGWALPDRGRLLAAPGDIFIANIWSSAGKWMIAGDEARDGNLIVTTGCSHFELIPGQEALLTDLVFGLCSEAFRVQMRALATGSDGLSSIGVDDIRSIVLPRMRSESVRAAIEKQIGGAKAGQLVLPRVVRDELALIAPETNIPLRSSHVVQV